MWATKCQITWDAGLGAEILYRKGQGSCESQSCSAHAGYSRFRKVEGTTPVSDSDAREGDATLSG